jgi:putative membrane protein
MFPMMGGGGFGSWLAMLLLVLMVAGAAVAVVLVAVNRTGPPAVSPGERPRSPEDVLRMRLARGEIDVEEYERRLAALNGTRSPID